jgi:hypothetical protein
MKTTKEKKAKKKRQSKGPPTVEELQREIVDHLEDVLENPKTEDIFRLLDEAWYTKFPSVGWQVFRECIDAFYPEYVAVAEWQKAKDKEVGFSLRAAWTREQEANSKPDKRRAGHTIVTSSSSSPISVGTMNNSVINNNNQHHVVQQVDDELPKNTNKPKEKKLLRSPIPN